MKDKLIGFYTKCMNCKNTKKECPKIWKDFDKGVVPRGFHFESPKIKLLIVGKNPGHPFKDEKKKYLNKRGKTLFEAKENFQKEYYNNIDNTFKEDKRSHTYHKNLFRYMGYFLGLLELPKKEKINSQLIHKIYSQIATTNLVKCSIKDEQAILHKDIIYPCYRKFFLEELKLFKPKLILALGKEVYHFLKHQKEIKIPIVCIKHPSYYYKKEEEIKILNSIKKEMKVYLK